LIELEITESSMVAEGSEILKTLSILQGEGIKILVDDFGTGYSSLSQLHRLNFDVLKVDQTFTAEIENSAEARVFFTAIVTMAHACTCASWLRASKHTDKSPFCGSCSAMKSKASTFPGHYLLVTFSPFFHS
jgi:predicted signal transduction protein with EAL and GGDEF domain